MTSTPPGPPVPHHAPGPNGGPYAQNGGSYTHHGAPHGATGVAPSFAPPGRVVDITMSIILMVVGFIVLVPILFVSLFMGMMSAGCVGGTCNSGLMGLGWMIALVGPPFVYVCAVVVTIVLLSRRRLAWWVPLVGILASVIAWGVGNGLASAGMP